LQEKRNIIYNKLKKIRDLINEPRKQYLLTQDKEGWQKLSCSLDVVDYTQLAINFYLDSEFPEPSGGKFLFSYGLLQSLYVQQDAIKNICEVFGLKINYKKDYPILKDIREKRNDLVGHPTNRNDKSVHYLTPDYLTKTEFRVHSVYSGKKYKMQKIDIEKIIENQETLIVDIIEKLENKILKEIKAHKKKFINSKMSDIFTRFTHYQISKLHDAFYENSVPQDIDTAKHFLESIEEQIEVFKKEIKKRYESLEAVPLVEIEYEEIESILKFIKDNLEGRRDEDINLVNPVIDTLKNKICSLIKICKDIDSDFSNNKKRRKRKV